MTVCYSIVSRDEVKYLPKNPKPKEEYLKSYPKLYLRVTMRYLNDNTPKVCNPNSIRPNLNPTFATQLHHYYWLAIVHISICTKLNMPSKCTLQCTFQWQQCNALHMSAASKKLNHFWELSIRVKIQTDHKLFKLVLNVLLDYSIII